MSVDGRISGWGWIAFAAFALVLCAIGYGIVRLSRRPQHLVHGQLGDRVEIQLWRAKSAWTTALAFGFLFAATRWVLRLGTAGAWMFFLLAIAFAAAAYDPAKRAFIGRTALVVDRDGLHDLRMGLHLCWREVQAIRVRTRQGSFDEYHELIMDFAESPTIEIPLDDLAMSWQDVARVVGELSGRPMMAERVR